MCDFFLLEGYVIARLTDGASAAARSAVGWMRGLARPPRFKDTALNGFSLKTCKILYQPFNLPSLFFTSFVDKLDNKVPDSVLKLPL